MSGTRQNNRALSRRIAFCGIIAALSAALMLLGGLIPVATYCTPLLAGLLLLPILEDYGRKAAGLNWLVTALLTLLLNPDREAAFFYIFIGWYPILKPTLDRIRHPLRIPAKLLLFSVSICGLYALLYFVLRLDTVIADLNEAGKILNLLFLIVLLLCLLLYDFILKGMAIKYRRIIKPKLRFLK